MRSQRRVEAVALALIVGAFLAGVAVYGRLPSRMAIHFGASGRPDNYVARPLGVALAPAIGVAALAIARIAPRVDPTGADPRALAASKLFLGGVIAYVQGLVLAWNLGYRLDVALAMAPVLVAAGVLVAYSYYRDG